LSGRLEMNCPELRSGTVRVASLMIFSSGISENSVC
jgi:hypothetical protein